MSDPIQQRSLEELHAALANVRADAFAADGDEQRTEVHRALCAMGREAMGHEQADPEQVVAWLTAAAEVAAASDTPSGSAARAVLLSNAGCVEKRRGRPKAAIAHLEGAADAEGGLAAASPATLINLSAAYAALSMFAEAAAVANHAVARCGTDFATVPPLVRCAAAHNLAVALEGTGELAHAADAYERALATLRAAGVADTAPQRRTIERALEQVELRQRNARAREEQREWQRAVCPAVQRQSQAPLRRCGALPPLKAGAVQLVASPSPPAVAVPAAAVDAAAATCTTDVATLYTASLRPFHALRSISPRMMRVPVGRKRRGRAGSREAAALALTAGEPAAAGEAAGGGETLHWNADPCTQHRELPHRAAPIPRSWAVDRAVGERYIPRALVPLVEGIRFKEATRRRALMQEWARRLQTLRGAHRRALVASCEDEARAGVEIEELRVFRVLQQYVRGKLCFAAGSARLAHEEAAARDELARAGFAAQRQLAPHAQQLQCLAAEEARRRAVVDEEGAARRAVEVARATATAARDCNAVAGGGVRRALCYALALWCVEGAVRRPDERQRLEDPAMRRSPHVVERYATFGAHGRAERRASETLSAIT